MANSVYKAVPTELGLTKIQEAMTSSNPLALVNLVYGDGVLNVETMHTRTSLVHQLGSTEIQSTIADTAQHITWITAIIGSNLPSGIIREVGLLDNSGNLCFIANTPEIEKVEVGAGTLIDIPIEFGIKNSYAEYITIPLQPSPDYATKQWVYDVIGTGSYANVSLSNINNDAKELIRDLAYGPILYDVYEDNVSIDIPTIL